MQHKPAENDLMNGQTLISDLELLKWQLSMGVDEVIADDVADWFEISQRQKKQQAVGVIQENIGKKAAVAIPASLKKPERAPTPANAQQIADISNDAIGDARKLAQSCNSLEELVTNLSRFEACGLSKTATNLCFIAGNAKAKIMVVGDAPDREDDIQGKPFVGSSGLLLDKMFTAIGLDRSQTDPDKSVLLCNMVFWRPPGSRKPTEAETLMCLPFISRLIELTKPKIILCLGAAPVQRLTGQTRGISQTRGKWLAYESKNGPIPVLASFRPSDLLGQSGQKSLAWKDMLALKQKIIELT